MVKTAYYAESDAKGELYQQHPWDVAELIAETAEWDGEGSLLKLLRTPGARAFGHSGEVTDMTVRVGDRYHYFCDSDYCGTFRSLRAVTRFVRAAIYASGVTDPAELLAEDYCGLPKVCLLPKWPWIRKVFETLEFPEWDLGRPHEGQAWETLAAFREKFLANGLPTPPPGVPTDIREMVHASWDCPKCGAKAIGQGAELWCTDAKCGNRYPRWVRKG